MNKGILEDLQSCLAMAETVTQFIEDAEQKRTATERESSSLKEELQQKDNDIATLKKKLTMKQTQKSQIYVKDLDGNKIVISLLSGNGDGVSSAWVSERCYKNLQYSFNSIKRKNPAIKADPVFYQMIDGEEYLVIVRGKNK